MHFHGNVVHSHAPDDSSLVQIVDAPLDPSPAVSVKRMSSDVDTPPLTDRVNVGEIAVRIVSPPSNLSMVQTDPDRIERPPRHQQS